MNVITDIGTNYVKLFSILELFELCLQYVALTVTRTHTILEGNSMDVNTTRTK